MSRAALGHAQCCVATGYGIVVPQLFNLDRLLSGAWAKVSSHRPVADIRTADYDPFTMSTSAEDLKSALTAVGR